MKKLITFFVFVLVVSASAFAENTDVSIATEINYKTKTMILSGSVKEADIPVTLNILRPGETPEALIGKTDGSGIILFCGDALSDEDGGFEFKIKVPDNTDEGLCTIYLAAEGKTPEVKKIYWQSLTKYSELIDSMNNAAKGGYVQFSDTLKENIDKLLFASEYDALVSAKEQAYKILYNYAKDTGLDRENSVLNSDLYDKSVIIQAVLDGKLKKSDNWIEKTSMFDDDVIYNYNKYITDTSESCFNSHLKDGAESFEDFKKSVKDAVILTAVKFPNGVDNVKIIMEQYAEYLDITTSDAVQEDYSKLAGGDFDTTEDLTSKFNSIKAERRKSNASSSPSSGGNGSGKSPVIGSVTADAAEVVNDKPDEINMKFVDLNPVPWAYEAISMLYSRNIISGRTETEFYPEVQITREEFAKLLVCLLGFENESYDSVFSDAKDGEWYTKYINIAYSKGICRGTGDSIFGVGESITREDMAVMAYNSLNGHMTEISDFEFNFKDETDFSDYSKTAVGALSAVKIVNGTGDNNFSPKAYATRAEAAVIIYNMLEYVESL